MLLVRHSPFPFSTPFPSPFSCLSSPHFLQVHSHAHTCTHLHTYTFAHTHTHTHTHTHVHMDTCTHQDADLSDMPNAVTAVGLLKALLREGKIGCIVQHKLAKVGTCTSCQCFGSCTSQSHSQPHSQSHSQPHSQSHSQSHSQHHSQPHSQPHSSLVSSPDPSPEKWKEGLVF